MWRVISVKVSGMDEPEVPAAALLMSQFRRLAALLVANGVEADDLHHEVDLVVEGVPQARRRRLHVVPAAG